VSALLTARDTKITLALLFAARVMTVEQISYFWVSTSAGRKNAERRARRLMRLGLLARERLLVEPIIHFKKPLIRYPEDGVPDPDALEYAARKRWTRPPALTFVYFATPLAAAYFGGTGREEITKPHQVTHDAHVMEAYLHLLAKDPGRAKRWVGEDNFHRFPVLAGVTCDAAILSEDKESIERAIDFGGSYRTDRWRDLHEKLRSFNYEVY
jgi:hypothetical protein